MISVIRQPGGGPQGFPCPPGVLPFSTTGGALGGPDESQPKLSQVENKKKKEIDMVQQQPGDQLISGILGGQVDAFQLAPALPWESPLPFVPRYLARRLWPGGFVPGRLPAQVPPAPQPVIQPPAPANQVVTQPAPAQPQPAARLPRDVSAHEPIQPTSQRVRIVERKGM
ncbi:hypothetical protein ES703_15128 [subsurface metagenome]